MYRCHMQFYLVNCPPKVLETIADLPALEGFDHAFTSSREPKRELLARADVVLAVPTGGEEAVRALTEGGKPSAQLILLADKEQTAALGRRAVDAAVNRRGAALPLPALAGEAEDPLGLVADQPVFGGHDQQHPQPGLV